MRNTIRDTDPSRDHGRLGLALAAVLTMACLANALCLYVTLRI